MNGKLNKSIVLYGDKALCLLLLLFMFYSVVFDVIKLSTEPEEVGKVKDALSVVGKFNAPAPKLPEFNYDSLMGNVLEWDFEMEAPRRSIFYKEEEVDFDFIDREYKDKLKNHECSEELYVLLPDGDGEKQCVFPGCKKQTSPPKVYIGKVQDLSVLEETIMTVSIQWKEPSVKIKTRMNYCLLQKRVEGDKNWSFVLDDDGEPLKVFGETQGSLDSEKPFNEQGEVSLKQKGVSGGGFILPKAAKKRSGFQLPTVTKKAIKAAPGKVDVGDDLEASEPLIFRYYDFNLKANSEYHYRVKAMGLNETEPIEGEWSSNLIAKTKEDKGIVFTHYIPGIRGKDGEIKKDKKGNVISGDKVRVLISKQFSPPWASQKYFVKYSFYSPVPAKVGKNVFRFTIKTEEGSSVYKDFKNNFMFVGYEKVDGSTYTEQDIKERDKKRWKPYKISKDFTTDWYIEGVEEKVEVKKVVKQVLKNDKYVDETEESKQYRYFLNVVDKKTGLKEKLELMRKDYRRSLRPKID